MTSTPHDPAAHHHDGEVVELGGDADAAPQPAGHGRRRGLVVGGGLLAALLVGGGVTYAVGAVGGGGATPEEVIPASAFAFVKVDLDPSAGQKVGALRFARKFPDAKRQLGSSDDPREALFEALSEDGRVAGDWRTDVQPWLGKRGAVAVLPGATAEADPVPVVVLAVTDAERARAGLRKVSSGKAQCSISGDFAVCASDAASARAAVSAAGRSSLADDDTFGGDVSALGGEGVATAWVDLAKARSAVPALASALRDSAAGSMGAGLQAAQLKGRYVTSLRFDGDDLELTGRVEGADAPAISGTSGVGELPAGTVAAAGTAGAGELVAAAWKQLRTSLTATGGADQLDQQLRSVQQQLGITIPDDVQAALGDRAVVAYGGMAQGTPQVALRVSGDSGSVSKLVAAATKAGGGSLTLASARAGTDTVVASTKAYADSVASGSGLGGDPVFAAAVPDAKDAQQVLYVNVAALLGQLRDTGRSASDANLEPLQAVGMSAGRDGSASTFTIRLTTR